MTGSYGAFVVSGILLALYFWKNWLCCLCKSFGGSRLESFGTQLLRVLLVPSSTPFYLTTFMMLSMYGVVLRTFLAPLPLACSLSGILCLVIEVLFLLWKLQPSLRLCVNTYVVLTVMPCIVLGQPHLLGLSVALTITGLDLLASVGGTVNFLYLVGVCSGSYSSGLALTICLLSGTNMLQGLTVYAHTVEALLLLMNYI